MQQHPLYRDLVQPVALAVFEVRCGLSLLKHAAGARPDQQLADAVLADCMALPSQLGQGDLSAWMTYYHGPVPLPTWNKSCDFFPTSSARFLCCLLCGLALLCLVPVKVSRRVAIMSLSCCQHVTVLLLLPLLLSCC